MGVWIDEAGRLVRPPEPAWTSTKTNEYGGKRLATEGEQYVAALRDWVINGEKSAYALSDAAFAARVQPRDADQMEADARFALAVWLHEAGQAALAATHFARAQALCPGKLELSPAGVEFRAGGEQALAREIRGDERRVLSEAPAQAGPITASLVVSVSNHERHSSFDRLRTSGAPAPRPSHPAPPRISRAPASRPRPN
jgi:hypothetical protein